ncbi:MAG: hypothetical protein LBP96_02195 [Bacteroidales bacterium]|jgi:uncharacterized UPF0146 family protein|nr:hypothetical protein [Bacteroidales bacterium]
MTDEQIKRETRKEIAKWVMDVAKYVTTTILVASLLGEFKNKWIIYTTGLLLVASLFFYGIKLLNKK